MHTALHLCEYASRYLNIINFCHHSLRAWARKAWQSTAGREQISRMAPSSHSHSTHSTRDHFRERPSTFRRILLALPTDLAISLQRMADQQSYSAVSTRGSRIPRSLRAWTSNGSWRHLFSLPHLLVLVWALVLLYGERWVFEEAVQACAWDGWERWVGFPDTGWKLLEDEADDMLIASQYDAASFDIFGRSTTYGSSFLPRSTMAAVDVYIVAYG